MLTSTSEKLINVTELREKGKYNDALDLVLNIENDISLTAEEIVECKLLKGWIYFDKGKLNEALEIAEEIYRDNRESGDKSRVLDAIWLKGWAIWFLNVRDGTLEDIVMEFEEIVKKLRGLSKRELIKRKAQLVESKCGPHVWKGEMVKALEGNQNALQLYEGINYKIGIARNLFYCAVGCMTLGKYDQALEYELRRLELVKKMENIPYILQSLNQITNTLVMKGELDLGLDYGKQALAFTENRSFESSFELQDSIGILNTIGMIYKTKGELDQALEYTKQAFSLAEESKMKLVIGQTLINLGEILYYRGNLNQASDYLRKALKIGEKSFRFPSVFFLAIYFLIRVNVDSRFVEEAKRYLSIFGNYLDQYETFKSTPYKEVYRLGKAYILKASHRVQDKKEAEKLLIQVTKTDISPHPVRTMGLIFLCEILLERIRETNNLEILNQIKSIINQVLKISDEQHSFRYLVYAQLLQAKLALIEKEFESARTLFTQAQKMSEWHGFNLFAQIISHEHDKFLEDMEKWKDLHRSNTPLSKRIKISGMINTLEVMSGKGAIDIPELEAEYPVLLAIMSKTGYMVLTNPFSSDITFDEKRIGEFVSFFNTISDQMFSESLDRAKFGDHTILLKAHDSLSICYLFEGKSYLAKLRLNSFYEAIKKDSIIMELLNTAIHTGHKINVEEVPTLESLIAKHFLSDPHEIGVSIEPDDTLKLIKKSRRIRKLKASRMEIPYKLVIIEVVLLIVVLLLFTASHFLTVVWSTIGQIQIGEIFGIPVTLEDMTDVALYIALGVQMLVIVLIIYSFIKRYLKLK